MALTAVLLGAGGCSVLQPIVAATPLVRSLSERVDEILEYPPYDQVQWGLLVVDTEDGKAIYRRSPSVKLIPASNLKLAVAAAALEALGPDHRFETALRAAGDFDEQTGLLVGDLVVVSNGDPSLSSRFWEDDEAPLRALGDSLSAAGLTEVSGRLIVDASGWDSATAVGSWMVEDLPRAATGGAFALAEGTTTVVVSGAAMPGEPPRVSWSPRGEDSYVLSRVVTVPPAAAPVRTRDRLRATYFPESRAVLLEGSVPPGAADTILVGTRDPVRQSVAALERTLAETGTAVRSGWGVAWSPGHPLGGGCVSGDLDLCGAPVVARIAAPPLIELVRVTLETSHNWMAEQLVRALGSLARLPGDSAQSGRRDALGDGLGAVRRYLVERVGVDSLDLVLRDGSGLSTQNLLTPRALVAILRSAQEATWGDAFRLALAEPGEADGTLEDRLLGLEGRVFAKTGTLTNVSALSGYVIREEGAPLVFSIVANGSGLPTAWVEAAIDQIVRVLAEP